MGKSRTSLQSILDGIMGVDDRVYFQPPPDVDLKYPCIVYERDTASSDPADNIPYSWTQGYQVTYIDHNPDGAVIAELAALPMSSYNRHFVTSGLNHDVFVIYH